MSKKYLFFFSMSREAIYVLPKSIPSYNLNSRHMTKTFFGGFNIYLLHQNKHPNIMKTEE